MDEEVKSMEALVALDELNEEFYRLAGRLYENIELLPEPLYKYISARLMERYKEEYSLFELEHDREIRKQRFRRKQRYAYAPWKFLFFKNRAAKEDIADFRLEFAEWLEEREKRRREAFPGFYEEASDDPSTLSHPEGGESDA